MDYIIDGAILTDIADAIREKTGGTEAIAPEKMASKLLNTEGDYERGYAEGYETGNEEGYTSGHAAGVEEGYETGHADGIQEGKEILTSIVNGTITDLVDETATKTRNYAFYVAVSLERVSLPNVVNVGQNTFTNCSGLVEVNLPKASTMKRHVFRGCTSLQRLVLPALEVVQTGLCTGATSLTYVDLPSATEIEATTFDGCTALTMFILRNDAVAVLNSQTAFEDTPIASGTGYVYVPDTLVEQYKAATNWATFASQIKPISELEGDA